MSGILCGNASSPNRKKIKICASPVTPSKNGIRIFLFRIRRSFFARFISRSCKIMKDFSQKAFLYFNTILHQFMLLDVYKRQDLPQGRSTAAPQTRSARCFPSASFRRHRCPLTVPYPAGPICCHSSSIPHPGGDPLAHSHGSPLLRCRPCLLYTSRCV